MFYGIASRYTKIIIRPMTNPRKSPECPTSQHHSYIHLVTITMQCQVHSDDSQLHFTFARINTNGRGERNNGKPDFELTWEQLCMLGLESYLLVVIGIALPSPSPSPSVSDVHSIIIWNVGSVTQEMQGLKWRWWWMGRCKVQLGEYPFDGNSMKFVYVCVWVWMHKIFDGIIVSYVWIIIIIINW